MLRPLQGHHRLCEYVSAWQHINLLGEYGFSDEKLDDTVGIRPPLLTP